MNEASHPSSEPVSAPGDWAPVPDVPQLGWTTIKQAVGAIFEAVAQGFAWLDAHQDEIARTLEGARSRSRSEWQYLLGLMDAPTAMMVAYSLEASEHFNPTIRDAVDHVLEGILFEPGLLAKTREAVHASDLPEAPKKQIAKGLDFIADREYVLSVPMLIIPIEGAFFRVAERRGAIQRNQAGEWIAAKRVSGRPPRVAGIGTLLELAEMDLPGPVAEYVKILAYGKRGNDHRHGTADDGFLQRSLLLFTALLGWLELTDSLDPQTEVRAASHRQSASSRPSPSGAGGTSISPGG